MSKKVLLALLIGYCLRAFQKGPIWIGIKSGLQISFLKIMKKEFPKAYETAASRFSPADRERMETKLRSV